MDTSTLRTGVAQTPERALDCGARDIPERLAASRGAFARGLRGGTPHPGTRQGKQLCNLWWRPHKLWRWDVVHEGNNHAVHERPKETLPPGPPGGKHGTNHARHGKKEG